LEGEEHGLTIEPLFQVKAWLIRRNPTPIFPTVQPIAVAQREFYADTQRVKMPEEEGVGRSLVWADPHFGYTRDLRTGALTPLHDEHVLQTILEIAGATYLDRIDILGDILDLADWSDRFARSPEFAETTQAAIVAAHQWLAAFRARCPAVKITVHEGNHDARLEASLAKHLQSAYDLRAADELDMPPALSIQRLLALESLNIRWAGNYPDDGDWLNDGVRLSHGEIAQATPGSTARAVIDGSDSSEIFGHVHRLEMVSRVVRTRGVARPVMGVCVGCACRTDGVVPSAKSRMAWQNGCAIVDYDTDGDGHSVFPIPIDDGRAIWDGRVYGRS
jgi:hypothetical protein